MKKYVLSLFVLFGCIDFISAIEIIGLDRTRYRVVVDDSATVGSLKQQLLDSGKYPGAVFLRAVYRGAELKDNNELLSDALEGIENAAITVFPARTPVSAAASVSRPSATAQITFKTPAGEVSTLKLSKQQTFEDAKKLLSSKIELDVDRIGLSVEGKFYPDTDIILDRVAPDGVVNITMLFPSSAASIGGLATVTVHFIGSGKKVPLQVDAADTIKDLKNQIGKETGENVTKLVFQRSVLKDDETIASAGIEDSTVMAVVSSQAAAAAPAAVGGAVYVKMPDGSTLTPDINAYDTFANLKFLLASQLGVPATGLRLIVRGVAQSDSEKILDHVGPGEVIQLVRTAPSRRTPGTRAPGGFGAGGFGAGGFGAGGFGAGGFAPAPAAPGLTQAQKVGAGLTIAALTAAVAGLITRRSYRKKKALLIKKYALGSLTPLQNKIWLATLLASYRMPWNLRAVVRNNAGSLIDFLGDDPRAVAELYYGHMPSKNELDVFIQKFFAGIE